MTAKSVTKTQPKNAAKLDSLLKQLLKDKLFVGFWVASLVLVIVNLTLLFWRLRPSDFAVPLRYSTYQGFDSLGAWYRVYAYGVLSLGATIANTILAALCLNKSRIASFFLVICTVVINLFSFIIILTLTNHLET